jgi:hypothetical protein
MGRTMRYSSLYPSQRADFARKVKEFRNAQGWRDQKLTDRYNEIVNELLKQHPGSRYKTISRSVMNRFLNMTDPKSRGQLRCVRDQDFEVFSRMLSVPVSVFTTVVPGAAIVDTPGDLAVAQHFQQLLGRHLENATELVSAAEYLPCSLEDSDFTHWHHKSLFDGLFPTQESCDAVINEYDEIGRLSRDRLDKVGRKRNWMFTHIMVQSKLDEIATPSPKDGQYWQCSFEVRAKCLQRLINLVSDPEMKIQLLIVRDHDVQNLRWLKAWDSIVVVLDQHRRGSFSFWRDHNGIRQRSEDPDLVVQNLTWLEQLRASAAWSKRSEVTEYLKREMARLEEWRTRRTKPLRAQGVA